MEEHKDQLRKAVEQHKREITAYCYRMTGCHADADDLTQETFLRAWKGLDSFESRSSLRTWLFRIATNTCLDRLSERKRSLPQLKEPASLPNSPPVFSEEGALQWLEPCTVDYWQDVSQGPEAQVSMGESVTLAFMVAMQALTPTQRAALLLCDVFGWSAKDTADHLQTTVAAVNSALQRARGALAERSTARPAQLSSTEVSLVERYLQAWRDLNPEAICALLSQDATLSMPPAATWYQGSDNILAFLRVLIQQLQGFQFVPTQLSGGWGMAIYNSLGKAHSLHVVGVANGKIVEMCTFIYPELFTRLGVPGVL